MLSNIKRWVVLLLCFGFSFIFLHAKIIPSSRVFCSLSIISLRFLKWNHHHAYSWWMMMILIRSTRGTPEECSSLLADGCHFLPQRPWFSFAMVSPSLFLSHFPFRLQILDPSTPTAPPSFFSASKYYSWYSAGYGMECGEFMKGNEYFCMHSVSLLTSIKLWLKFSLMWNWSSNHQCNIYKWKQYWSINAYCFLIILLWSF